MLTPIKFEKWGGNLYCPFCGAGTDDESTAAGKCSHVLYIVVADTFGYLSPRLARDANVNPEDYWDYSIDRKFGGMERIVALADKYPDHIQFQMTEPNWDIVYIGFAASEEEPV